MSDLPPDCYSPNLKRFPSWFNNGGYTNALGLLTPFTAAFVRSFFVQEFRYGLIDLMFRGSRAIWSWVALRLPLPGFVSGQFVEGDPAYEWVMAFLVSHGVGVNSNNYAVAARGSMKRRGRQVIALGNGSQHGVEYIPNWLSPQLFSWNGYWLEVEGNNQIRSYEGGYQQSVSLYVTMYTFRSSALSEFVQAAREQYALVCRDEIVIHLPESLRRFGVSGDLIWTASKKKQRRPLESVILEDNTLEDLLEDARDFLRSANWYKKAGIPHRRGYLLHGPPGTGKSSTIHSLAGELEMEIYALSMSSAELDDSSLQRAVSAIPGGSILLIEDIDVAFPSRSDEEEGDRYNHPKRGTEVTLSGLLNVLDGIASDENKLFFATTNYPDRLDSALIRPGRIDRKVTYHLATPRQACILFQHFYSPDQIEELDIEKQIDSSTLAILAQQFSSHIPDRRFSTAAIQGYLLRHKASPEGALSGIQVWVEAELEAQRQAEERRKLAEEKKRQRRIEAQQAQYYGFGDRGPGWPYPPYSYPAQGPLSPALIPLPLSRPDSEIGDSAETQD